MSCVTIKYTNYNQTLTWRWYDGALCLGNNTPRTSMLRKNDYIRR